MLSLVLTYPAMCDIQKWIQIIDHLNTSPLTGLQSLLASTRQGGSVQVGLQQTRPWWTSPGRRRSWRSNRYSWELVARLTPCYVGWWGRVMFQSKGRHLKRLAILTAVHKHRTLSNTLAIYHDQEWQVFLKAIWVDRSPWSRYLMGNSVGFGTSRNDWECAHKVHFQLSLPFFSVSDNQGCFSLKFSQCW